MTQTGLLDYKLLPKDNRPNYQSISLWFPVSKIFEICTYHWPCSFFLCM